MTKNAEVARKAAEAIGAFQDDALGLGRVKDMPDRIRTAIRILSVPGGTAEAGERLKRASLNADHAASLADEFMRGIALHTAIHDVLFVISERMRLPDNE